MLITFALFLSRLMCGLISGDTQSNSLYQKSEVKLDKGLGLRASRASIALIVKAIMKHLAHVFLHFSFIFVLDNCYY